MPVRTVLKPFPFAADHINLEDLVPGDERDFPADVLPGLEAAGFVEAPAAAAPEPAESAPADAAPEAPAEPDAAPEPVSAPAKPARKRA
jgi:hypothetical protein